MYLFGGKNEYSVSAIQEWNTNESHEGSNTEFQEKNWQ